MSPPSVLVLTADPATGALDKSVTDRLFAVTGNAGRWLAPFAAYETPLSDPALRDAVTSELRGLPIDINTTAFERRAKKLVLSDMDSTMIEQEAVDELAVLAGRVDEIAAITLATMSGDLDFEQSLRHRVSLLTGLTSADIATAASRLTLMPGAAAFVASMKQSGAVTALVSGGFTAFVDPIAMKLGFDRAYGNVLEIANDRLTGRLAEPILDADTKRAILLELTRDLYVEPVETLAVGDGANDIPMLQAAGLGVAFRAKPAVRAAMRAAPNGAVIDHADLTALLHLQGLQT